MTERHVGTIRMALRTGTGLNDREHWATKMRRVKSEHQFTAWAIAASKLGRPHAPIAVLLTRVSPATRRTDDDNLRGGLKSVRDSVAAWIGIDDGDSRIEWRYAQERGDWGVRIDLWEVR